MEDFSVAWSIQGAVYGIGLFSTSVYYMMVVVVPVFVNALNLSYFWIGVVLGCRPVLSLFLAIHAGSLMDRIGGRRVMIFFGIIGILAPLMYPVAPAIGWIGILVVAQMLAGLADSMGWLGAQTLIGQHMKGRTKYTGRLSAVIRIGHAIAPIMVGIAWDKWGAWAAFGLMSVWNTGFLVCALLLPSRTQQGDLNKNGSEEEIRRISWRDFLPAREDYISAFRLLALPAVAATVMVGMMPHVGNYVQSTFYVVWLEQSGITGTMIGFLISIASIGAAGGSLLAARFRRYFSPYWLFWFVVWVGILLICITPLISRDAVTTPIFQVLSNFNSLSSSSFDIVAAPGFLTTGGAVTENGVGSVPYILTMKGVTDLAQAANASEYGLFTDSGFGKIPEGGNPFPVEYDVTTMTYDTVVLGKTIAGGGFGSANAYATKVVELSNDDVVPPEIYLKGAAEIIIEVGQPFVKPGYTAIDDEEGDLTHLVEVGGDTVDTATPGDYTLTYNVSDTSGNKATEVTRKVTVRTIDRQVPVITLLGDALMNLLVGEAFTDPGVTATDDIDGNVTADVVAIGADISTAAPGVHVIKYNVSDASGNEAVQVTRTVVVKTPLPPGITIEGIVVAGTDITITVATSGTHDHWHVSLDTPLAESGRHLVLCL